MKTAPPPWQHLLLAFVLSLLLLCGLISWLQNVHIVTANGMYKSIQVEPWISDPANAPLDHSNYHYFPLYGRLCALLDFLGILRGQAWKQLAYLNAFWASIGSVLVYAFAWRLTGSAAASAAATVFHLGTGFVLLLAVISEDIMPGYVILLASMMLAGLWFGRPSERQVAIVGVVFTLGWLVEWRLIFPTLPALLLALAISQGPVHRRARLILVLVLSILATTGIVTLLWSGHANSAGFFDLLYTGKGVNSGWAGLVLGKLWVLLSGVSSYFLMVDVAMSPDAARRSLVALLPSALIQLSILATCLFLLWPDRKQPRLRSLAAVFLGTFGAGTVFNTYSQPQDPQMQINVMVWLTVAWTLLLGVVRPLTRTFWIFAFMSVLPLAWNIGSLVPYRGRDATSVAALGELERRFPPDRTVFIYWGFEPITMWHFALWSHTWDFDVSGLPPPAPSATPKFKWIAVDAGGIRHPRWTAEENAQALKRELDGAFDRGYRVVASPVWLWSVEELANQLGMLSASGRAPAMHAVMQSYELGPAIDVPGAGTYYELRRR